MRVVFGLAFCLLFLGQVPLQAETREPSAAAALQTMAKAVLEAKDASQKRALEEFAAKHRDEINGILAYLVLGYQAYQEKKYSQAKAHFQAANTSPSVLQDYAQYYRALSEEAEGSPEELARLLQGFAPQFPSSPFARLAVLKRAAVLLRLDRSGEVISLLEVPGLPAPPAQASLLLGEAYGKLQQPVKAARAYQGVYYEFPASEEAREAARQLRRLKTQLGKEFPLATLEARQGRADKLYAARQWQDAQQAYKELVAEVAGATRDQYRVRVGVCQYQARATWPAITTLKDLQVSDPEAAGERLYTLAALYGRLGRKDTMEDYLQSLEEKHPQSPWREKALFLAANYFFLAQEADAAERYYRRVYEEFPQGENAATSHWKVAWRAYRERRLPEARQLFEEHVRNYASSPNAPAALYWLARLVEEQRPEVAAPYYWKLAATFPYYYYGVLARQRLGALPGGGAEPAEAAAALLENIRRPAAAGLLDPPASSDGGQPHWLRARLLESAWLLDWAVEEMQALLAKNPSSVPAGIELARLEKERERHHVALRFAKRFVRGYLAMGLEELERPTWELLFPLPWRELVAKHAGEVGLELPLVAGLIRQESEFDPQARSRSNARGLMQLLPSTARQVARRTPAKYSLASLYQPEPNLIYGTRYLREMLDRFSGSLEQAVAAYNAGPNRVAQWLREDHFEDPVEFVESIPLSETREYVQAVLRNAELYRTLYRDGG